MVYASDILLILLMSMIMVA